jgi:excisionase family DNA binding protein
MSGVLVQYDKVESREGQNMPRTQRKPALQPPAPAMNGPTFDVLTLAEAAAYLRLPDTEVVELVQMQDMPGRRAGTEWRFLKSAIQEWLSRPQPKYSKEAQLAAAGSFKDDPDLLAIVEDAYRKRGRPITEDGSYNLLHRLETESGSK